MHERRRRQDEAPGRIGIDDAIALVRQRLDARPKLGLAFGASVLLLALALVGRQFDRGCSSALGFAETF